MTVTVGVDFVDAVPHAHTHLAITAMTINDSE